MRSTDLTAEQLRRLVGSLKPKLVYLERLRLRMEQTGFPDQDRVLRDARIAEKVLHDLLQELESLARSQRTTYHGTGSHRTSDRNKG